MATPKILAGVLALLLALAGIDFAVSTYSARRAAAAGMLFPGLDPAAITQFSYRSLVTSPPTEFTAQKSDSGFAITQPIAAKADSRAILHMAGLMAEAKFSRKIAAPGKARLAEFGLEEPVVALAFTTPDERYHLTVGSRTPAGFSRYAAVVGKPDVYVIDDGLYMAAAKSLLDFRDRRIVSIPLSALDEITYQASPEGAEKLSAVKLLRDGQQWRLEDGQRGSSTSITDFVTALNNLHALRIVDNPSEELLAAFNPRRKSVSPLMSVTFGFDSRADIELTVLKLENSLLAYQNPRERLYFLPSSAAEALVFTAYDFTYRKVLSLDWQAINRVDVGKRSYLRDAKTSKWQATGKNRSLSPLTLNIKAMLIDLEFAKASAIYDSDQLPESYDDAVKTEVLLSSASPDAQASESASPDAHQGEEVTLNIAKMPHHNGGVAIIQHSKSPDRYYEVNLATTRHLP